MLHLLLDHNKFVKLLTHLVGKFWHNLKDHAALVRHQRTIEVAGLLHNKIGVVVTNRRKVTMTNICVKQDLVTEFQKGLVHPSN